MIDTLIRLGAPRRLALGFAPSRTPGLLFVAVGIVLGPAVLNLISPATLALLDPVVSMALAVMGAFIGAGFVATRQPPRVLSGAAGQAIVTFLAVGAAMWLLFDRWRMPLPVAPAVAALIVGLCSAASAAIYPRTRTSAHAADAAAIADLDDLPILVLATIAVPFVAGVTSLTTAVVVAVVGAVVIATAGMLLFSRAHAAAERGVVATGALLLLGGAAAYTNTSPLTTGLVAGILWQRSTQATIIGTDVERLQHPLLALLMIAAGAAIQVSWALLWIAAPLVVVRLAGKTSGGLLFARLAGIPPGLLSALLLPPGVLGIALALNFQQVIGGGDTLLLSAVTVSTLCSEVLARAVVSMEESP